MFRVRAQVALLEDMNGRIHGLTLTCAQMAAPSTMLRFERSCLVAE